jgi:hypothetical protein
MTKSVRMLNKGTDILEEVLEAGKTATDKKSVGFDNYIDVKFKVVPKKTIL